MISNQKKTLSSNDSILPLSLSLSYIYLLKYSMTSVKVEAPDLASVDPAALAVAKFLYHNKVLKEREGIIHEKRQQFFRGKYKTIKRTHITYLSFFFLGGVES